MTPKLEQYDQREYVNIVGRKERMNAMQCESPAEAAAIVRACEHFDALLGCTREAIFALLLNPPDVFRVSMAMKELREVIAAIDGDTPCP